MAPTARQHRVEHGMETFNEPAKRFWEPSKSSVEKVPNNLVVSYEQPGIMRTAHWHAQVEINYVIQGAMDYKMHGHGVHLQQGDVCLFWGGLPHQVVDTSVDAFFLAIHLPLLHFFRLRLPESMQNKLMRGATLITRGDDAGDSANFLRWSAYMRSGEAPRRDHAIDELLLRIERVQFEPYRLVEPVGLAAGQHEALDQQSFANIGRLCDYIAENFRYDIDSVDIANSADIHPKYAMSVFKKSTGMTLNEYVNLLRLSYAQALLMADETNVLHVAMDSGFGSLSAFNSAFRKISGCSPSDFRRDSRSRANTHGGAALPRPV
jgi:AraC-like DNA-binding protein